MDRLLKDRKMASASARRQRVQERDEQNQILRQQREDSRHRRVWYNSETSSSAGDSSRCESPENDSAVETPSEYSARTPDNLSSPEVEISGQSASMSHGTIPSLHIGGEVDMIHSLDVKSEETLIDTDWLAPLNSKTTEFPYYRFSTFVGLPSNTRKEVEEDDERTPVMEQISEIESEEEEDDEYDEEEEEEEEEEEDDEVEEEEEDEDEEYSPIEVATSVAYSLPQNKPSLISVSGSQTSPIPPRRRGLDLMHDGQRPPLTLPTSPVRSYTFESKHSYFPSISSNSHSRTESNATSFVTISSTQDDADFTVKKKHSIPMLGKFTHNRIHSLKNFIKPNPLQIAPDLPQMPSRNQHRPSNPPRAPYQHEMMYAPRIQSKQLPAEPRRSLTELNFQFIPEVMRPQTAHNPNQLSMTSAPLSVNIPGSNLFMTEELRAFGHGRKKSFSDLRKRNGSISSVLKMTTSMLNLVPEKSPLPPVPNFDHRPSPSESRPIIRMPNHISRTSASGRSIDYSPPNHFSKLSGGGRIAPYSSFPRAGRPGELVGLGLRL